MLNKKTFVKLGVIVIFGLLLVGVVSAVNVNYSIVRFSNPTYQNGSEITYTQHPLSIKQKCIKYEWNDNFEKWRNGIISKEDMKIYIRGCKW